jgi:hypothetical protein
MTLPGLRARSGRGRFPSVINTLCPTDALPCPTQLLSSGRGVSIEENSHGT